MARKYTRRSTFVWGALALGVCSLSPAWADEVWPQPGKPIRIVVPLPAGSGSDVAARLLGKLMSDELKGHPVIIDNKPGASTMIGAQEVARAPADGHTLLYTIVVTHTQNPHLYAKLPYDPVKDFTPLAQVMKSATVLIAAPNAPFSNLKELVAYAKAHPDKMNYASYSPGSTSHLNAELLQMRTGTKMLHVPYKGGAPAVNDTLAGNVDMLFAVLPEALPHIQAGKLHALGLMNAKRTATLPNTPTMAESGFADLNLSAWVGLFAPAKTPQPVIDKLNRAVRAALDSDIKNKLGESGMEVAPYTPEQLKQTVTQDIKLHAELVKAAGIQPQ